MNSRVAKFEEAQLKNKTDIRVGDIVRVHQKIKEGDKERNQIFEGLVIAKKHGKGISGTFTVRKVTSGVGVEKIFPIHMPAIEKIEIVKSGKVRQSKIYYIREATGRKGRLKEVKRNRREMLADEESDKKEEEIKEVVEEVKEAEMTEEAKEERAEETEKK